MDLTTFAILALAIGLGFFVQTVAGFAAGLLALPIILLVYDLPEAIAFLSVFLAAFSVIQIAKNHKDIDRETLFELGIGIVFGVMGGVYLLKYGDPQILTKILGLMLVLYVINTQIKKESFKLFPGAGIAFGLVSGVFSGLYASGGPIIIAYLYNKIKRSKVLRGTTIGVLAIPNMTRLPILIQQDILTYDLFKASLYIFPFFLISMGMGQLIYDKINEVTFKKILLAILLIEGILLIIK
ncbi:MAG: sulfite exporter TauE/SafE family protein [Candidatus Peregrinibacteria bacterium]|nr:sulfite exporter TauE/SafE family protein [Candidatus Peregrinibacteria bacterium]